MLTKLFLLSSFCYGFGQYLNACHKFEDYFNITKENCFFNPDMSMNITDLIKKYTGQYKSYRVTTEDGYILRMFRIPRDNPKGVILLHHSLGTDARIWIGFGKDSLAFSLWRDGYDVWMNSNRGTPYSQKHKTLSNTDRKFWDYSFHDVGYYDVPAEIKVIRANMNDSKIIYIGHSFGSSVGLVYGSTRAKEAEKYVELFIFMASPAIFNHTNALVNYFVPIKKSVELFGESLQLGNVLLFLPIQMLLRMMIQIVPVLPALIEAIFSAVAGNSPDETDPAILNIDAGVYIKALSWKSLLHYLQLLENGSQFQMFDYGKAKNLKMYKRETPPEYPLENFTVPTVLMSSDADTLTTLDDSEIILSKLPERVKLYDHIKIKYLNHLHYFIGKHRVEQCYDPIRRFLQEYSESLFK